MNMNLPALGAIGDASLLRTVFYQSGRLVHGPYGLASLGVSSFAQTLLDDANATTARATLGSVGLTGDETVAGAKTFSSIPILSGGGIAFPATQNPSADANTLDDYEEGDFTPALTFGTPGDLSVVYGTQVGSYEKTGRSVLLRFNCETTTFTHGSASGNFQITGLPFSSANVVKLSHFGPINHSQVASGLQLVLRLDQNDNKMFIGGSNNSANNVVLDTSHFPSGRNYTVRGSLTYRT